MVTAPANYRENILIQFVISSVQLETLLSASSILIFNVLWDTLY